MFEAGLALVEKFPGSFTIADLFAFSARVTALPRAFFFFFRARVVPPW